MEKKKFINYIGVALIVALIVYLFYIALKPKEIKNEPYINTEIKNLVGSDINGNLTLMTYPTFQSGSIMLWSGSVSSIPSGWILCDGRNGSPDLRGRFVVCSGQGGVDSNGNTLTTKNVDATGGEETHLLKINEIPAHSHAYSYSEPAAGGNAGGGSYWGPSDVYPNTNDQGGNQAHNNMPPWYALCYIYYTGSAYNVFLNNTNGNLSSINFPLLPAGIIMSWSGTTIPKGWSICDGTTSNGYVTPDLRGRFVVGVGQGGSDSNGKPLTIKNVGDNGGEETHELTVSELPTHNHSFLDRNPIGGRGQYGGSDNAPSNQSGTTGSTGGNNGKANKHENMPPWYALYYICYTGSFVNNLLSNDINGNIKLINYPLFPVGMIMIWRGSINNISSDWAICDGQVVKGYQTPNLQCRFVVGVGQGGTDSNRNPLTIKNLGDTGGKEMVALDIKDIPPHSHNYSYYYATGSSGLYHCGWADSSCRGPQPRNGTTGNKGGNSTTGLSDKHENMPPWYALYYICYVGY